MKKKLLIITIMLLIPAALAEDRGYWDSFTTLDELTAASVTFEESDHEEYIEKLTELIFEEVLDGDPNQVFEYQIWEGPGGITLRVRKEGATAESLLVRKIQDWLSSSVTLTDLFELIKS